MTSSDVPIHALHERIKELEDFVMKLVKESKQDRTEAHALKVENHSLKEDLSRQVCNFLFI
jgi:regulator of replication initiation timing